MIKLKRTDTTLDLSHCENVSVCMCFATIGMAVLTKAKRAKGLRGGRGGARIYTSKILARFAKSLGTTRDLIETPSLIGQKTAEA